MSHEVIFYEDTFPFEQKELQNVSIDPFLENFSSIPSMNHHDDND